MNKKVESLSFLDHLDELRERLIKCLIVVVCLSSAAYLYIDPILTLLTKPVGKLIYTSPADAFLVYIISAIFVGIILSLPIIIYQVWQFIGCGLKENERKYIVIFAPVSALLFIIGGMFAYFIAIPFGLKFLLGFSSETIVPMITIKSYISFVVTLILAFGVIFEMPLILMFLTKIGIATPAFLIQKRKHAIVLVFIISALITPPDVITQLIMAGPLMILYEIGVIASKWVYRKNLSFKH